MNCTDPYAVDAIYIGLTLAVFGLVGLIYAARAARRAALGDLLLSACGGDYETAVIETQNIRFYGDVAEESTKKVARQDPLMRAAMRDRVRKFHDEDAS